MDSTLLSMECLDSVIETAMSAQLHPDAIADAMKEVEAEMDKGMAGAATIEETIPARIEIAKRLGAPVSPEHFEIVAQIVPNSLTQSLVEALRKECSVPTKYPVKVSVVSGGPQICVDAAVSALQSQILGFDGSEISFLGIGNKISVTEDGDFDQLNSQIKSSKVATIQNIIGNPAHSIMVGDGSTDVEVYDSGAAHYFIAIGLWQRRDVLFDRPDNRPYYRKVDQHGDVAPALHEAIHASQE